MDRDRDQNRGCSGELWDGANHLEWEHDYIAQRIVEKHGPLTLDEIGACMGLCRERVRQIEEAAMRKLLIRMARCGYEQ